MPCDADVLKQVPLFSAMDPDELAILASQVEMKTFAARQRLLSPGQYEIVDVRAGPGVRRAMLLPKGI